MSLEGRIYRDKEEEQIYLDLLKDHFKDVKTFEKYPDATMNMILSEAFKKILGKNFSKKRISLRKEKKIKKYVREKLEKKYGRWITLTNFKIKSDFTVSYGCNLPRIFDVKNLGRLYGCQSHSSSGNIFLTSHCLERFEERSDPVFYEPISKRLFEVLKTHPTAYDILSYLIRVSNFEYGKIKDKSRKEHIYLNTMVGYIVLENFGDVFIAKTFMSPEMAKEKIKWYQADVSKEEIHSFAEILNSPASPISEPTFLQDMIAELMSE